MFHDIVLYKAVLIFFGYAILDYVSSWFYIALSKLQVVTTTTLTFLLYLGGGAGIYEYTHNFTYLLFAASGACLGNFILVFREKRRKRKTPQSK